MKLTKLLLTVATLAAMASTSDAAVIQGRFGMTFGTVVVSLGEIDFATLNPGLNAVATNGSFTVDPTLASRSGSFLDPAFNSLPSDATIGDLSGNPADANFAPVGLLAPPRQSYITLAEKPNWQFILTELVAGQLLGGNPSPFVLTQNGSNVSATFSVNGIACDSANTDCSGVPADQISRWTAVISAQYTNTTVAALVGTVVSGGSLPENTWSGTFEATVVPEPGTWTLLLAGLGLAGIGRFRRR